MADKVITGCWACGKLDHESQDCAFKRCFICSEQGHEARECMNNCFRCKSCNGIGHEEWSCPLVVYGDGLGLDEAPLDVAYCRCATCGQEGHIQCGRLRRDKSGQELHMRLSNGAAVGDWRQARPRMQRVLAPMRPGFQRTASQPDRVGARRVYGYRDLDSPSEQHSSSVVGTSRASRDSGAGPPDTTARLHGPRMPSEPPPEWLLRQAGRHRREDDRPQRRGRGRGRQDDQGEVEHDEDAEAGDGLRPSGCSFLRTLRSSNDQRPRRNRDSKERQRPSQRAISRFASQDFGKESAWGRDERDSNPDRDWSRRRADGEPSTWRSGWSDRQDEPDSKRRRHR